MKSSTADILVPEYDSPSRKSTIVVAIFNLTASIMGGGVLSIPFAFSKTGILLGALLMVLAAIVTERSMYLLCLCSRITGAKTFGEVGEAAFGKNMEYFISYLLSMFLMFAIIGYMVLAKDIWTSIIRLICSMETPPNDELVLGAVIILIFPLMVQKSLYALRFSCYVGFLSVTTLCVALVRHALAIPMWPNILWWSTDLEDILIAFPIISLTFVGIFNVLPIQNALVRPSRSRMLLVLDGSLAGVLTISLIFGLAGCLYAGAKTEGNILNNFETAHDLNLLLGKLGCGTMVTLGIPILMIPCRSSLIEILDVLVNGPHMTSTGVETSEKLPLVESHVEKTDKNYNAISNRQQKLVDQSRTVSISKNPYRKVNITDSKFVHFGSTFLIFTSCYMVAVRVPGVAIVWSILGCSLSYLVAFILPSACYLKITKRYPAHNLTSNSLIWFSWILLLTSIMATVVCTAETIKAMHESTTL